MPKRAENTGKVTRMGGAQWWPKKQIWVILARTSTKYLDFYIFWTDSSRRFQKGKTLIVHFLSWDPLSHHCQIKRATNLAQATTKHNSGHSKQQDTTGRTKPSQWNLHIPKYQTGNWRIFIIRSLGNSCLCPVSQIKTNPRSDKLRSQGRGELLVSLCHQVTKKGKFSFWGCQLSTRKVFENLMVLFSRVQAGSQLWCWKPETSQKWTSQVYQVRTETILQLSLAQYFDLCLDVWKLKVARGLLYIIYSILYTVYKVPVIKF